MTATAPLWTAQEMAKATRGRLQGAVREEVTGISIDTRTLAAGESYFAIKGDRLDGHDFVEAALGKGAALAVRCHHRDITQLLECLGQGCQPRCLDTIVITQQESHLQTLSVAPAHAIRWLRMLPMVKQTTGEGCPHPAIR